MIDHPGAHARAVKQHAASLGFDACNVAAVTPADPNDRLGQWLARGFHADMAWMETTKALRQEVRLKLPEAKSVIVVAKNYYQPDPPRPEGTGRVARYAWGRDYHRVMKKPLQRMMEYLQTLDPGAASFHSVDSGPVLERSWAARAGLGWTGKNSLILRRDLGSWFFLGTVVTTLELAPDEPMPDYCGSCTACIDACPTDAIVEPQVVDSNRCISYQTIENRGDFPPGFENETGEWVFGCDICQDVCPWNRFARPTAESDFAARPGVPFPPLDALLTMPEVEFNDTFAGSPIRRAKHAGMQRNAAAVARNLTGGLSPSPE